MKSNNRFLLLGILVIAAIMLAALFFFSPTDKKYSWNEEYRSDVDQPYDISLLKNLTEEYFTPHSFKQIENLGPDNFLADTENSLLIYVSDYFMYDSVETSRLLDFVSKGSSALIISRFPNSFYKQLNIDTCFKNIKKSEFYREAESVGLSIKNSTFENQPYAEYYFKGEPAAYFWDFLSDSLWCNPSTNISPIGAFETNDSTFVNMVEIKHGKGSIILNTNPLIFSNYNLRRPDVLAYTEKVYSFLPFTDVYWSEFDYTFGSGNPALTESPLRFILSQPALKWAWYLSILLIMLYVIFNSRRKQKLIPLIADRTNNSPSYIDAISRLYKLQGKHRHIIKHQEELLLSFLRNKYKIHTSRINSEFYKETARKTKVPAEDIKSLFYRLERMKENSSLSDEEFLKMNSLISNFYEKCK